MSNVISKIKICKHEETLDMTSLHTEDYYNKYLGNLNTTIHSCGRTNNTLVSFKVTGFYGELDILMQTGNLYIVGYSIDDCNYILPGNLVSYNEEPSSAQYSLASNIEAKQETVFLFAALISESLRFKPIKGYFNKLFKASKFDFSVSGELLFAHNPLFHFNTNGIGQRVTIKSLRNDWQKANSEQYSANGQIFFGDTLIGEKYIKYISSIQLEKSCLVYNDLGIFVSSYDHYNDCISPKDNKCSAKEAKKQKLTAKGLVHKNIKYFSKILENEHEINLPYNITYKFTYLDVTKTILITCVAAYGVYYFIHKLLPYLSDSVSHYKNEILDRAIAKLNVQEIQGQIINKFDHQLLQEQLIKRITNEVLDRIDFHNLEERAIARAAQMVIEKIPSDFIERFPELMRKQFSEQVSKTIRESIDIDTLNNHLQDAMLSHAQEEISMEEIKTGVVNEFVGQIQSQISTLLDQRTQYYDHT